jgi:hypothetical protein
MSLLCRLGFHDCTYYTVGYDGVRYCKCGRCPQRWCDEWGIDHWSRDDTAPDPDPPKSVRSPPRGRISTAPPPLTADRVREIVHEELSHHALAGGVLDGLVERAVRNYLHDALTVAHLTPGVAALRDWARAWLHRADDKLAALDTAAAAEELTGVLWEVLRPVVGTSGLPRGESPGGAKGAGAGAVGPRPP